MSKFFTVTYHLQRQAVDALSKMERAEEGTDAVKVDIRCMVIWLRKQHSLIEFSLFQLYSQNNIGESSVVNQGLCLNEKLQSQYSGICHQLLGETLSIVSSYSAMCDSPVPSMGVGVDVYDDDLDLFLELSDDDLPKDDEL